MHSIEGQGFSATARCIEDTRSKPQPEKNEKVPKRFSEYSVNNRGRSILKLKH
jgi:hypothetical protein